MKKFLLTLAMAGMAITAFADCRFEIDSDGQNTVHFPRNAANTDDEYKRNQVGAVYDQSDDGVPNGASIVVEALIPPYQSPANAVAGYLELSSENTGEACALEVDGDSYTCDRWVMKLRLLEKATVGNFDTWRFIQRARDCN